MKNGIAARVGFGSLFMISILACNLGLPSQTQPQENPVESQITTEDNSNDPGCKNPFIPVVLDASWTYKSSGSPRGEHLVTETISDVRADGFTVTTDYGSAKKAFDWSCTPEGLRVFGSGSNQAEGLSVDSGQWQLALTIKNASGVTLPVKINTGDLWIQTYEFESTGDVAGNTISSLGTAISTYEFLGMESITTPAGIFQAIKIKGDTKEDTQATVGGSVVNSSNEHQTMFWFVEGIGRVRSETTGSYTETMELQSYSIP